MIETDRLTKRYGEVARHRGAHRWPSSRARCSGSSDPTARARRPRSARCWISCIRRAAAPACSGSTAAAKPRDPRPPRQPARRVLLRRRAHGPRAAALFAALRGVATCAGAGAGRALRGRPLAPLGELSRGNRQKIGLIQALFHEPELLILDEPTAGLDPLMQEEFLAVVAEERERGATVFLSSHELDEVQRACDRVGDHPRGAADRGRGRGGACASGPTATSPCGSRGRSTSASSSDWPACATSRRRRSSRFQVSGDIDAVVKAAARHQVRDLEVTRPTLEELFLTYYRAEAGR